MNTNRRAAIATLAWTLVLSGTAFSQRTPVPPPQGFHLVVLLADNKPGEAVEGLPAGVNKALTDVRELLPFKSYRVLDTVLLRGSGPGTVRVAGAAGREYTAELRCGQMGQSLHITFWLKDYPSPETRPPVLTARFEMAPGETVVVGTSRVKGTEQALVLLLTALTGAEAKSQR